MKESSIGNKIIRLIAQHLDLEPSKVTPDTSFEKDLNVDSMDAMDLLVVINEEFGTKIPPEQMEKIQTVQEMIDAVKSELEIT